MCERLILRSILFSILRDDLSDAAEYTLSKFKDGTKFGGVVDILNSDLSFRETSRGWRVGLTGT